MAEIETIIDCKETYDEFVNTLLLAGLKIPPVMFQEHFRHIFVDPIENTVEANYKFTGTDFSDIKTKESIIDAVYLSKRIKFT